jgi:hypothetical protein
VLRFNTTVPTAAPATRVPPTTVSQTLGLVASPQAPQRQNIVAGVALPNTGSGSGGGDGRGTGWVLAFGCIAGGVLLMMPAAVRLRKRDER